MVFFLQITYRTLIEQHQYHMTRKQSIPEVNDNAILVHYSLLWIKTLTMDHHDYAKKMMELSIQELFYLLDHYVLYNKNRVYEL